ncbi:MAG: metal-sulfur cluster assembly factor [Melioribacteraceae bacterium]|jgi:metal-sulfur cluster biosynthetic enzyme|nr:metal-sulfur cluster assembly factor [Melioribacteraceae bacterium]
MVTEELVRQKLKSVIDPEVGFNIVDMGLVYGIDIKDKKVIITMTLTTPGCPMHDSIMEWAERVLKQLDPVMDVKINLVWEPEWTPDMMSNEIKEMLGY